MSTDNKNTEFDFDSIKEDTIARIISRKEKESS